MKRRLFNLAAVVSLMLCLASVAMWVRSSFVTDQWSLRKNWTRSGQSILFAANAHSTTGGVEIVSEWGHADQRVPDRAEAAHVSGPARELIFQSIDRTWPEWLGLRVQWEPVGSVHGDDTADGTCIYLNFPYWVPAIAFAGLPLIGIGDRDQTAASRYAGYLRNVRLRSPRYAARGTLPGVRERQRRFDGDMRSRRLSSTGQFIYSSIPGDALGESACAVVGVVDSLP